MKTYEISAMTDSWAITPCAKHIFFWLQARRQWVPMQANNILSLWHAVSMNRKVHRGIYSIRVAE